MTSATKLENITKGDPLYDRYILYRGRLWTLYLNSRDQRFLGRAYVWLTSRHEDNMPFDFLSPDEHRDLMHIMRHYRLAVEELWGAVRINSSWLGNEVGAHRGHGHMHLIPRYERAISFNDRLFRDSSPNENYAHQKREVVSQETLFEIRDAIKNKLGLR